MAEIIDARVKQKTGVAADFAGYTLLEGEIALVRTSASGPVWNFKVGPGNFDSLDWSLQNPGAAQKADTSTVFPVGVPGLYIPTESGTYDGVTVDLSSGYTQLIWDGSALVKAEFPIDLSGYVANTDITQVINPMGSMVPNEVAVADYIDLTFFSVDIDLGTKPNQFLTATGSPQTHVDFEANEGFIPVSLGDVFIYTGKVTSVGTNLPSSAYAAIGYTAASAFAAVLLDNTINEGGRFEIADPSIDKIRACSRIGYGFSIQKITNNLSVKLDVGRSWASIGDSITAAGTYQRFIQEEITFTSFENRGYPGRGFADDGANNSILNGILNIGSFDIYTLFGGTNDFKLNHPIGVWDDYLNDTGSNTFYGALRKVVDLLFTANPACLVVIITPLRRDNDGYTSFSINTAGHTLGDYREALIQVANHEGIGVLDFFMDSGITDRNLGTYTVDGLHPNEAGHKLLANRIGEYIKNEKS